MNNQLEYEKFLRQYKRILEKEDGKFTQEGIQRIYGSDKTIGTVKTLHLYPQSKGKNT